MAGIDASIMTSDGTCKLVIPLLESTIAKFALFLYTKLISDSISDFLLSGKLLILSNKSPNPFLKSTPKSVKTSLCFSTTSAKKILTACPKIIGSETFIIVAFI